MSVEDVRLQPWLKCQSQKQCVSCVCVCVWMDGRTDGRGKIWRKDVSGYEVVECDDDVDR